MLRAFTDVCLTEAKFGKDLESFGENVFRYCTMMERITVVSGEIDGEDLTEDFNILYA